MSEGVELRYRKAFTRRFKKLNTLQQDCLVEAVRKIKAHPEIGDQKKGNLAQFWIYKFKMNKQLLLLAYTVDDDGVIIITIVDFGSHENLYRQLGR